MSLSIMHGRVVLEGVADHEDTLLLFGDLDQALCLGRAGGERLLDQHVLAGQERRPRQGEVAWRRAWR